MWCLVDDSEINGVLFNNNLFDELTVVNSRSGVCLRRIVFSLVLIRQANFGRGRFITDFLETVSSAVAAVMVCCLVLVLIFLALACKTALVKSASLDDDTSLELWSSILCVVESARLVVGFFNLFFLNNSDDVTLIESTLLNWLSHIE